MRRVAVLLTITAIAVAGLTAPGHAEGPRQEAVAAGGSAAETIAAGWGHTCAIVRANVLRCSGENEFGQLGNGTTSSLDPNSRPYTIQTSQPVKQVAAGLYHTCVLYTGNWGVSCWGWNGYGQLGTGDTNDLHAEGPTVDVADVTSVVAGGAHTCALTSNGSVFCWGENQAGELGNGQAGCDPNHIDSCYSTVPVAVAGLGTVVQLAAGADDMCALNAAGAVRCWGDNQLGQLGNGKKDCESNGQSSCFSSTPVGVAGLGKGVASITVGTDHACALTDAGGVKCWGDNQFGQLGNGASCVDCFSATPVTAFSSGGAVIAAGWNHTCAITTKDAVACWGRNQWGEVGDGTTTNRHKPVPVKTLGSDSGARELTAGYQYTCVELTGDDIECWGRNDFGQLGDGVTKIEKAPRGTLFAGPTVRFALSEKGQRTLSNHNEEFTLISGEGEIQIEDWPAPHGTAQGLGGGGSVHVQRWEVLANGKKVVEDSLRLRVVMPSGGYSLGHSDVSALTKLKVVVNKSDPREAVACENGSTGTLLVSDSKTEGNPDVIVIRIPHCGVDETYRDGHTGKGGYVSGAISLEPRP